MFFIILRYQGNKLKISGLEVIKLVCKQPIIVLYFEFENLEAMIRQEFGGQRTVAQFDIALDWGLKGC